MDRLPAALLRRRYADSSPNSENQIEQLKKAGCERIYTETASGGRWERPELQACLKHLRRGDVLVVWKLDRLSRSLSDLLRILQKVEEAGAGFKSLTEMVDTTTPSGRLMMNMLGSFSRNSNAPCFGSARRSDWMLPARKLDRSQRLSHAATSTVYRKKWIRF